MFSHSRAGAPADVGAMAALMLGGGYTLSAIVLLNTQDRLRRQPGRRPATERAKSAIAVN